MMSPLLRDEMTCALYASICTLKPQDDICHIYVKRFHFFILNMYSCLDNTPCNTEFKI